MSRSQGSQPDRTENRRREFPGRLHPEALKLADLVFHVGQRCLFEPAFPQFFREWLGDDFVVLLVLSQQQFGLHLINDLDRITKVGIAL